MDRDIIIKEISRALKDIVKIFAYATIICTAIAFVVTRI